MYSVTNTTSKPVFITQEKKFLIVPIIFRRQIEKFIESSEDDSLGFIFGDDRETFSIIKKVWTVDQNMDASREDLLKSAKEMALASGMKLLGLFYNNASQDTTYSDQFNFDDNDLTSVELVIENGCTKAWVPHSTHQNYSGTIIEQKIIL